jgi:hypothetical protein
MVSDTHSQGVEQRAKVDVTVMIPWEILEQYDSAALAVQACIDSPDIWQAEVVGDE